MWKSGSANGSPECQNGPQGTRFYVFCYAGLCSSCAVRVLLPCYFHSVSFKSPTPSFGSWGGLRVAASVECPDPEVFWCGDSGESGRSVKRDIMYCRSTFVFFIIPILVYFWLLASLFFSFCQGVKCLSYSYVYRWSSLPLAVLTLYCLVT